MPTPIPRFAYRLPAAACLLAGGDTPREDAQPASVVVAPDGVARLVGERAGVAATVVGATVRAVRPGRALVIAALAEGHPPADTVEVVVEPFAVRAAGAGYQHTCAIVQRGAAYCWGFDHKGAIGAGTSDRVWPTPTRVQGGLAFSAIAGGQYHTCGLTAQGVAYCWGYDNAGQLGTGIDAGPDTGLPVRVLGGP